MSYKGTKKKVLPRSPASSAWMPSSKVPSSENGSDRVKVTAELIDGSNDQHLWADSYERDLQDVLLLQSEVARAIARKVLVEVTPEDRARLEGGRRIDPAAYEAYVQGTHS